MLVLSSHVDETILFPTLQTTIKVLSVQAGTVRLAIESPEEVRLPRETPAERTASPLPLDQLVDRRLAVARLGLTQLSQHLAAGRMKDAETILGKIDEDLHLLRRRLRSEGETLVPRSSIPYGHISPSN